MDYWQANLISSVTFSIYLLTKFCDIFASSFRSLVYWVACYGAYCCPFKTEVICFFKQPTSCDRTSNYSCITSTFAKKSGSNPVLPSLAFCLNLRMSLLFLLVLLLLSVSSKTYKLLLVPRTGTLRGITLRGPVELFSLKVFCL